MRDCEASSALLGLQFPAGFGEGGRRVRGGAGANRGADRAAIALPAIETVDPELLLRALEVYERDRLDFAEAYVVAQAEASGVTEIRSFDRTIDGVDSVTRREP
jgi:predicted nucleic acid-binding protein